MSDHAYVYGLVDPHTNALRYIGVASDIKARVRRHIWNAKRRLTRMPCPHVVKSLDMWLKSIDFKPQSKIIGAFPKHLIVHVENVLIVTAKLQGHSLLNEREFSQIPFGRSPSEETRALMRQKHLGKSGTGPSWTQEDRKRIGQCTKERWKDPEIRKRTIEGMRKAYRKRKGWE
jgi:hypothetical protein